MSNLHLTMRINGVQAFPAGLAVQFSPCSAVANNGGFENFRQRKGVAVSNWSFPDSRKQIHK